jgi:peptidoglycan/xylan/chitin deacetylase (PgdA/CDA1 family)
MVQSAYMIKREQKALMAEDSLLHDFKDKINHLLALQSSLHKIKTFFSENKLSKAKKEVQALEEYIKKEENGLEQIANKIGRVERKRYSFQKRVERIIPNLEKKLFLKKKINLNEKKKVESVMDDIHTLSARAIKELSYRSGEIIQILQQTPIDLKKLQEHQQKSIEAVDAMILLFTKIRQNHSISEPVISEPVITRRDFLRKTLGIGGAVAITIAERKMNAFHRLSGILFDKSIFGSNEIHKVPIKGVLLTIDDGPAMHNRKKDLRMQEEEKYFDIQEGMEILRMFFTQLSKNNYPAIFFWVGKRLDIALRNAAYRKLIIQLIRSGFTIGNHSYSHKPFSTLSIKKIMEEIDQTDSLIEKAYEMAGVQRKLKLLRFPYGDRPSFFDRGEVYKAIKDREYKIMFWSKDTKDWEKTSTIENVQAGISGLHNGDILLLHERHKTVKEFLEPICTLIKSESMKIAKLERLDEREKKQIKVATRM